ncbi:MAG TPA: hypothetical protein VFG38_16410 [Pseudomonadales bacterium]|nr:hypothetical protein [Pseudomonadales bacterium]
MVRLGFLLPLAALAWPVSAAVTLKEHRTSESKSGTRQETVEVVSDGDRAKLTFIESSNPMMTAGSYVLATPDTTYFVFPDRKSYMRIDTAEIAAMKQTSAQMNQKIHEEGAEHGEAGGVKTVSKFSFKPLVDEEGPTMLGMPTRHYKFQLAYTVSETVPANKDVATDHTVQRTDEFWATNAVQVDLSANARKGLAAMGGSDNTATDESLPQIGDAFKTMHDKGLRLKSITDVVSSGGIGGSGAVGMWIKIETLGMNHFGKHELKETSEVLAFQQVTVPKGTFDLPKGYTESSMMGPGAMPNLNQMPNMPGMPQMPPGTPNPNGNGGMPNLNQVPQQ